MACAYETRECGALGLVRIRGSREIPSMLVQPRYGGTDI
jgi:hypothetical protein